MIKTIFVSAVVALVVALGAVGLVGNQTDSLGAAGTRFPNGLSTISTSASAGQVLTKSLKATNGSGTTTVDLGKVCFVFTSATGTVFYASYNGFGALATSTASCL